MSRQDTPQDADVREGIRLAFEAVKSERAEANPGFRGQAFDRLRDVQAAVTDLLANAGLGGARPTDMGRRLGLDKTLAWKVSRFVGSDDPAKAARHMPGAGGVEILVNAAGALGVKETALERTRQADRALRAFMAQHAGDRRSFEAMLAAGRLDESLEFEERRAYFRAGSALWGVRARLQFLMLALYPSADRPGYLDAVQVSGLVGLERLRPDVPWLIRRLHAHSDSGRERFTVRREPLVTSRRDAGLPPLFEPYCSQPLPDLSQFEDAQNGLVYDELAAGPVGREGAVDVILGERYLGPLPLKRAEDNTTGRYMLSVRTPVECVLFDLLLHESLTHFGHPDRSVVGLLEDRPAVGDASLRNVQSALLAPHPAVELGSSAVVHTPRLGAYPSMVADALTQAGAGSLQAFRGYRHEVEYPTFPCNLRMTLGIGESLGPPSGGLEPASSTDGGAAPTSGGD